MSIYISLKGLFLFWSLIIDTGKANKVHGQLPDLSLISTLFSMFVKPYFKTRHPEPVFGADEDVPVEKAIIQKVEQLIPFLQDNESNIQETENKFTFEGNDDTTVIEFLTPTGEGSKTNLRNENNTFKASMRRYKKLRTKINKALEKELVSDKTKTLVIKTLDEMIGKMIETQCNWKSGYDFNVLSYRNRLVAPKTIVNRWNEDWQKFKTIYSTLVNYRTKNDAVKNVDTSILYLNSLNSIIKEVSDNLELFSKRYRFNCSVHEREDFKKNKDNSDALRNLKFTYENNKEKNACKYFKVCSTELRSFFTELYSSVNDTTVSVLRSYGEMFTRDVNTDVSNEKKSIVSLIFNIGNEIEKEIINIFVNDISQFKLDDQKSRQANIILLSNCVRNVTRHVKQEIDRIMRVTLENIPNKIYQSIQQDVATNLDVDLGNLERDLVSNICLIFNVCNNRFKSGRRVDTGKENDIDPENRIYVKVDLTIDDEFKDALKNNTLKRALESNSRRFFEVNKQLNINATRTWIYEKYANISVTRTTRI